MTPMKQVRVLLTDDHSLYRQGMADILNSQPDFSVVGEARDGLEAIEKAKELRPDLILMDIGMPRCDGLEATKRIKAEMPYVVIVMLTMCDEDEKLIAAIKNGAQGYLLKSMRSRELVDRLREETRSHWRASLEDVQTGDLLGFEDLAALHSYLYGLAFVDQMDEPSLESRADRDS